MRNIGILIKTLFRQQFRIDKSNKRSKSIKISLFVSFGIIAVTLLPLLVVTMISYSKVCVEAGIGQSFLSSIFMAIELFALIFGTIMLVNTLFFSKDNAFLATLPIKPTQIFFAKLAYVAVNELIFAGTVGLIVLIIYGVVAKLGVLYYILGIIAVAIAPLLSLLASSILLFPLMYIMSFVKKNTILTSIVSLVLYVGGFIAYFIFISNITGNIDSALDTSLIINMFDRMGKVFFFNYSLAGIVLLTDVVKNLLIVIAVWGIGIVITYLLSGLVYRKGVSRQAEVSSMKIAKTDYEKVGLLKALMKRDWKEIVRDNSLFFYCIMQVIMAPLMIILLFGVMYKGMDLGDIATGALINVMGLWFFIMFSCGANYVATSAITRENRKWYLMKVAPIPYTLQIRAKVYLAYIFTAITTILGGISLMCFGMNVVSGIMNTIIVLILGYGFVCWQVKIDLDKPRLNWTNIAEGLKNNPASMVTMFSSMGIGLVMGAISYLGTILPNILPINQILSYIIVYTVLFIFALIFALAMGKTLYSKTDSLFNKLEG